MFQRDLFKQIVLNLVIKKICLVVLNYFITRKEVTISVLRNCFNSVPHVDIEFHNIYLCMYGCVNFDVRKKVS